MQPTPPPVDGAEQSLVQAVRRLINDLPGLLSDRAHLFSLEVTRASAALGQMLGFYAMAALGGLTAWAAIWGGLVATLIHFNVPWGWAVALVIAANLVLVFYALRRAASMKHLLTLPATMRSLTVTHMNPLDRHDDQH